MTGSIFCAPSGLRQDQVLRGECPPPPDPPHLPRDSHVPFHLAEIVFRSSYEMALSVHDNCIMDLSPKKKSSESFTPSIWSEEISLVECISLDSNTSRVKIHYSTSGISTGLLDIHSKRSDH